MSDVRYRINPMVDIQEIRFCRHISDHRIKMTDEETTQETRIPNVVKAELTIRVGDLNKGHVEDGNKRSTSRSRMGFLCWNKSKGEINHLLYLLFSRP